MLVFKRFIVANILLSKYFFLLRNIFNKKLSLWDNNIDKITKKFYNKFNLTYIFAYSIYSSRKFMSHQKANNTQPWYYFNILYEYNYNNKGKEKILLCIISLHDSLKSLINTQTIYIIYWNIHLISIVNTWHVVYLIPLFIYTSAGIILHIYLLYWNHHIFCNKCHVRQHKCGQIKDK